MWEIILWSIPSNFHWIWYWGKLTTSQLYVFGYLRIPTLSFVSSGMGVGVRGGGGGQRIQLENCLYKGIQYSTKPTRTVLKSWCGRLFDLTMYSLHVFLFWGHCLNPCLFANLMFPKVLGSCGAAASGGFVFSKTETPPTKIWIIFVCPLCFYDFSFSYEIFPTPTPPHPTPPHPTPPPHPLTPTHHPQLHVSSPLPIVVRASSRHVTWTDVQLEQHLHKEFKVSCTPGLINRKNGQSLAEAKHN